MQKIESPGVNRKWSTGLKSFLQQSSGEWIESRREEIQGALEYYVLNGIEKDYQVNPFLPMPKPWGGLHGDLGRYAFWFAMYFEKNGLQNTYDVSFAQHAFVCAYTKQMIIFEKRSLSDMRSAIKSNPFVTYVSYYDIPVIALGVVIGCKEEAFRLARMQLLLYRHASDSDKEYYPIYQFIFRILADYLNEPPHELHGDALNEPILNTLFSIWRDPNVEILKPICMAACDYHTHRQGRNAKNFYAFEFNSGTWSRTPIEILLLFKLRQLLGLQNPVLDHPLMNSPLGVLPPEVAFEPDDLTRRVRERMRQDGFDELAIYNRFMSLPEVVEVKLSTAQTVAQVITPVPPINVSEAQIKPSFLSKILSWIAQKSPASVCANPSKTELELITEFLNDYEGDCANHGCNDFICPATEGNKAILIAAICHSEPEEEERNDWLEKVAISDEELFILDYWLVGYLAARCQKLLSKPAENKLLTGAELELIATVLELAAEEHLRHFSNGAEVGFTQLATPENKAFFAEVIKQHGGAQSESELKKLLAADDEITVPDFWVMRYFSARCKAYTHPSVIQKRY